MIAQKGEICNEKGECIPLQDAIDELEDGLAEDCVEFSEVESQIRPLLSEYRGLESQIESHIRKFNKEINDRDMEFCENKLISFSYYSVSALLDRMLQIEGLLKNIYLTQISFFSMTNKCPDFSEQMSAAGFNNAFVSNELGKFAALKERIGRLTSLLIENGCDPEAVIQDGQTVQPPLSDPNFVDDGGTLTELGEPLLDDGIIDGLDDIIVTKEVVEIKVWDHGCEDGDIISLLINKSAGIVKSFVVECSIFI